jgi:hypothetical protein
MVRRLCLGLSDRRSRSEEVHRSFKIDSLVLWLLEFCSSECLEEAFLGEL